MLTIAACTTNQPSNVSEINSNAHKSIFRIGELNTHQIESLDKNNCIVILVGGILEEHGPYLPSFTDGFWNERFADTLATILQSRTNREVILFPTIPLGNSGANDIGSKYSFPGTYTVRFETLRAIFMDLGIELGEQGFKNIVLVHGHGAPNHQLALDQAADFFNETYGGHMINLFGYARIQDEWFKIEKKTKEQEQQDGLKMHAGMDETSGILYLKPDLVSPEFKTAKRLSGDGMKALIEISSQKDWPGYFGSEAIATAELGKGAWKTNVANFSEFVLDIIEGKINPGTVQRFSELLSTDKDSKLLDSLSLVEEARRKQMQMEWLVKHVK